MEQSRKIGFDSEKYLQEQTAAILERVSHFNDKLYLEFGGKILYDYHAARVLPGFAPNIKMRLLQKLKEKEHPDYQMKQKPQKEKKKQIKEKYAQEIM